MNNDALEQREVLEKIKRLVEKDDRIIGMWAVGSMATGKADRYSDLDLYVLVEKENYDSVFQERRAFAERIGKALSSFEVEWPNCQLHGVILENFVEVDLCYCKPEQLEIFGPYRVIVDKRGNLDKLLTEHTVKLESDIKKRLSEQMDFAAYNLLHAINMFGRGEYWSSIRQVEILRKRIVNLIGLRTGADIEDEYRRLESLIDERTNKMLQETLCGYNPESIVKAICTVTDLFTHEAQQLCETQALSFPLERFERLLEYFERISTEKQKFTRA